MALLRLSPLAVAGALAACSSGKGGAAAIGVPPVSVHEPPPSSADPPGATWESPGSRRELPDGGGAGCAPCDEEVSCATPGAGEQVLYLRSHGGVCVVVAEPYAPSGPVLGCGGELLGNTGGIEGTWASMGRGGLRFCSLTTNAGCVTCTRIAGDGGGEDVMVLPPIGGAVK